MIPMIYPINIPPIKIPPIKSESVMNAIKSLAMWAVSIPVTWTGIETFLHGATTTVGFLTSLTGLAVGTLGVVYWARKIKKQ